MKCRNMNEFTTVLKAITKSTIYIVGAGKYGEILGKYLDNHKIFWEGFIDQNGNLKPNSGKKVISYQNIKKEKAYYIISSYLFKNEIFHELMERGIQKEQIIIYENQEVFYEIYEELVHWKSYTRRLKQYKGKYKGKRCFIIGNGPSLRLEDLEKLNSEVTFACNSIYALYTHTEWRSTYYCVTDSLTCKEMMKNKKSMEEMLNSNIQIFTSIIGEGFQYRNSKEIKKLNYICVVQENNDYPTFSDDISKQVYASGTIAYEMLQIAVYMGFDQIYLLGMDCCYSSEKHADGIIVQNNVQNHMEQIEIEEKKYDVDEIFKKLGNKVFADIGMFFAGYQSAKLYADFHGIKIYNATRGGRLEIFERVEFDSILN